MKKGDSNPALGRYVQARRESLGLDFNTLAARSGFNHTYWRKLEQGLYLSPDAKTLRIVADTLDCPLEDLYGLCGYTIANDLPALTPYLRAKFDLPPEAVADMERYFALLRNYFGVPEDQPVFPPEQHDRSGPGTSTQVPSEGAKNSAAHPWRSRQDRRAA
jgi:transcriptional regulator with XRE-family HTH domain